MHFALVVQYQIDSTKPSGLLSWEPDHSGHCPGPVCTSRVRGKASLQRHSLPKSSLLIFFICPLKSHLQALATRVLRVGHTEARREGKQKGKSECMGGGGVLPGCDAATLSFPGTLHDNVGSTILKTTIFQGNVCSHNNLAADHHLAHLRKEDGIGNKSFRQISSCHHF